MAVSESPASRVSKTPCVKKETTKEEYASGMREQVMNSSSGQDFALIAACDKARKQMLSEESGKDGRRDEDIGNPDEEDKSSEEETSENIGNDTGGNVEIQDVRFTCSTTRELNLKIDRYGTVKKKMTIVNQLVFFIYVRLRQLACSQIHHNFHLGKIEFVIV